MVYCENSGKLKDAPPNDTIHRIRGILSQMDIFITEKWFESVDGIFSVQLVSDGTRLMTNGKGTSRQYALASGYGEFMERLQNGALYRYKVNMSDEDAKYGGFVFAPDEEEISFSDLLRSKCRVILDSFTNQRGLSNGEMLSEWERIQDHHSDSGKMITLPFYSIQNKSIDYLPISILDHKYGTNGMCAGNTPQEAIVQGLSEILERYVNFRIIDEDITPPTIPDEILCQYPILLELRNRIEKSGTFKVILKDCSLGEDFPVVCLILIDSKNSSYFVKFAAHPHFAIAIERTLTELLQGRDIRNMEGMTQFKVGRSGVNKASNKIQIAATGDGLYPESIFREKASYALSGSFTSMKRDQDITNSQMMKHMLDSITGRGYDVLIRNVSFLGFPAFYLIVPGMSEITADNDYAIRNADNKKFIAKVIGDACHATDEELEQVIEKMDERGWHTGSLMSFAVLVKMKKNFSWHKLHYGLVKSCILIKLKQYGRAVKTLNSYVAYLERIGLSQSKLNYYRCIANILEALCNDQPLKDIIGLLSKFYSPQLIKDALEAVKEPFAGVRPFPCFNCCTCSYKDECIYDILSEFHHKWKDRYRQNMIHQDSVRDIIME